MQSKRIALDSQLLDAVSPQMNAGFGPDATERMSINYHNIWISIALEPQNAGANANGIWALVHRLDTTTAIPTLSFGNITAETFNQKIIACGCWVSSNEGPYTMTTQMKSSRTLRAGEDLQLVINQFGLTAGQQRALAMLCAHTTVK